MSTTKYLVLFEFNETKNLGFVYITESMLKRLLINSYNVLYSKPGKLVDYQNVLKKGYKQYDKFENKNRILDILADTL